MVTAEYEAATRVFAQRWWEEIGKRTQKCTEVADVAKAAALAAIGRVQHRPTILMAWGAVLMVEPLNGGAELRKWFEQTGLAPGDDILLGDFGERLQASTQSQPS